jgi:hypothetical protein
MIREQTLRARQKLVSKLPITGDLLRGSLLERTIRHTKGCPPTWRANKSTSSPIRRQPMKNGNSGNGGC